MAGGLPGIAGAQTFPSGSDSGIAATTKTSQDVLADVNSSQADRDQAALQLIAPRDSIAKSQILDVLRNGPDAAKVAVAKALGAVSWPDPDFQQPLMSLLATRDVAAASAAAAALAQYRDDPQVMAVLIDMAQHGRNNDIRLPVIRALGTFGQHDAAQNLVSILQSDSDDAVREAAADALIEMTAQQDLDHNAQKWSQWWQQNKGLASQAFHDAVIRWRGEAFEDQLARFNTFQNAALDLLENDFWGAPADRRATILLSYLHSLAPEIRTLGASLVFKSATAGGAPVGTIEATRSLLSDPSPNVRAAAATALQADYQSAGALVTQLGRENDDYVRVRILRALAPFKYQPAIEIMLNLVGPGQSDLVRIAAANAIRDGSQVINADKDLKSRAIKALREAMTDTDISPIEEGLRAALVGALSRISDAQLSTLFARLIGPTESIDVRANALIGLGNLPDPSSYASQIAHMLEDHSPKLRLAAVQALKNVPPGAYVGTMLSQMSPDSSDDVRAAAWNVLQDWAKDPSADETNLFTIADGLKALPDPTKELVIRQILCNRLAADAANTALSDDKRKAAGQQLAEQQQTVGDLEMNSVINQPSEAAESYKSALEYWRANNGQVSVINTLCADLIHAYLTARHWDDAATFASGIVRDANTNSQLRGTIPGITNEFLVKANGFRISQDPAAYDDAMKMFAAIDKMNPPLPGNSLTLLNSSRQVIESHHTH